jgi:hypothetical protein
MIAMELERHLFPFGESTVCQQQLNACNILDRTVVWISTAGRFGQIRLVRFEMKARRADEY